MNKFLIIHNNEVIDFIMAKTFKQANNQYNKFYCNKKKLRNIKLLTLKKSIEWERKNK